MPRFIIFYDYLKIVKMNLSQLIQETDVTSSWLGSDQKKGFAVVVRNFKGSGIAEVSWFPDGDVTYRWFASLKNKLSLPSLGIAAVSWFTAGDVTARWLHSWPTATRYSESISLLIIPVCSCCAGGWDLITPRGQPFVLSAGSPLMARSVL